MDTKYSMNDFFCGCGGIGLGFKQAGFHIAGAWDSNKYAVQAYKENVWAGVKQADIREMDIDDIPEADVWAFGFPCQDLSVAGLKAGMKVICRHCMAEWQFCTGHGTCPSCGKQEFKAANRSGLFFEIMRLLDQARTSSKNKLPDILMAENVKGLKKYIPILEEQHVYIPELSLVLEKDVEEKFYIPDKKAKVIISQALKSLDKLQGCHAVITPGRENKRQNGRRAKGNEEPMFTLTAQDLHGVIQNVFLTTDKVAYCCDSSYPKGIGPGTRARRTHVVEYKNEKYLVRKLTPYEYGLLQGFPMDKWKQTVSDSQAYKLFGNAVTVNVSNVIARAVHLFLESYERKEKV
ncbi:MAG: DNA cytosine methyltransferase [Lachnospiraceae bacterium]|nr:DNA cytosine methyltransferase [Lachnospiraceae bacterium]